MTKSYEILKLNNKDFSIRDYQDFSSRINDLINRQIFHIAIELKSVPVISARFLEFITESINGVMEKGGSISIINPNLDIKNLVDICHLSSELGIYETREDYENSFQILNEVSSR